mmetsp:Transcript_2160/g.5832  ORF Transcript_2160/g.5832 Transcript_2160/m.5832 type:complete len:185 (-) Transcript_2160:634-1188(-)
MEDKLGAGLGGSAKVGKKTQGGDKSPAEDRELRCELCGKRHNGTHGSARFCSLTCARRKGGFATRRKRELEFRALMQKFSEHAGSETGERSEPSAEASWVGSIEPAAPDTLLLSAAYIPSLSAAAVVPTSAEQRPQLGDAGADQGLGDLDGQLPPKRKRASRQPTHSRREHNDSNRSESHSERE